jgi:hypothetical protein
MSEELELRNSFQNNYSFSLSLYLQSQLQGLVHRVQTFALNRHSMSSKMPKDNLRSVACYQIRQYFIYSNNLYL